eukprot:s1349_g12.t1
MIAPLVEDMSTTSSVYWALLKRETEDWYRTYLVSDPMARLQLQPSASAQLLSSKWSRLSKRLEALLITASELIQGRVKSPLHLLCRLHVLYALGGVQEREHSLRNLQSPGVAGNAQAALESLRQWRRWLSRTESLGGSLPDPVILVKALLTIVKTVLEGNAEVQFRVGLVKAALKAETAPSLEVVHQLHAALLSEVEVLARTQTLKPKAQASAAAVSAGENPPPGPKAAPTGGGKGASKGEGQSSRSPDPAIPVPQGACHFYVQGIGCNRGDKCRNAHNWQDIPPREKKSRCMSCGGVGHQRAACPRAPSLAKPAPPAPPRKPERPERAEKPKAAAVAATPAASSNQVQALLEDAAKVLKTIQGAGVPGQGSERLETSAPKAASNASPVFQGTPVTVSSLQSHLDAIRQAIPEPQPPPEVVKVSEVCPAEAKGVEQTRMRPRGFWTQEPPMR